MRASKGGGKPISYEMTTTSTPGALSEYRLQGTDAAATGC
jgi:hypothetical protein